MGMIPLSYGKFACKITKKTANGKVLMYLNSFKKQKN